MRTRILALIISLAAAVSGTLAQTSAKGQWFVSGAYGLGLSEASSDVYTTPDGHSEWIPGGTRTFSKYGVMGGYLGKWGGYAKVVFTESDWTPNVTAGVTKRLMSWQSAQPGSLHLAVGIGFGPLSTVNKIKYIEKPSHDASTGPSFDTILKRNVKSNGTGPVAEVGAIANVGHLNIGLAYAINFRFGFEGPEPKSSHTIFLSVGYAF